MYGLNFSFLNGRLLFVDDKKNFIGYDPIFSDPMDFPADKSWDLERAAYDVCLDGECFHVKVKHEKRRTRGGFGLLGLEVFLGDRHMTTYLGFSSMPENSKHGSKWFFHNDCYYYVSGGWNFFNQFDGSLLSFDDVPMEEKLRQISKDKLYLVKFKSFIGRASFHDNPTIDQILTSLYTKRNVWPHALFKTFEAWDLKPYTRKNE